MNREIEHFYSDHEKQISGEVVYLTSADLAAGNPIVADFIKKTSNRRHNLLSVKANDYESHYSSHQLTNQSLL